MNTDINLVDLMPFIVVILWSYAYYKLKSNEINTFAFVLGSVGFFTIAIFGFRDILQDIMVSIQMWVLSFFENVFYDLDIYYQNSMILVKTQSLVKVIELNYECSGLIEGLVFTSIILFYPIKSKASKLFKIIIGNAVIIGANVLRILLMIVSAMYFSIETFDMVHLIIGKLLFYVIVIILYYKVLTMYHISQYKEV